MITHVIVELDAPIEEKYWEEDDVWSNEYCGIGKPLIRCKDCKFHHDRTQCSKRIGAWFDDDYCNGAVNAERKEE